ncbi:hypothetical protein COY43_03410 [Candidatus Berkelbacteria bacterium CG_4_10_14_0_8_um_filter_35_9_33_8]|uniref:Uncharacterized protein n=1 Tax=Candidatus Berkelbacteria bacterium CG_4_10_14_0_2_um_filter_35_9_33_12 TaxID=1974499 RepID=A0A2M7W4T0_9BACT|nr:MAG: hypothetical protein COY43_03410 [Candidatus Berkelbacteria bacterium CG_4_10_14_0_8_um_filter_35_9_33_8]PJA20686.1 MAG: hypothetical protein COX60_00990 [Candidatus Berkelbacteria bacterium CG_4_10_14_0_2_um_filter_35_9_33_12]
MKLDLNKVKKYQDFLEKMLEKSSKETVEKFTKEELSLLSKLIPGFDFQIVEEDKRIKIIGAIEASEILLNEKTQKKLQNAQSWAEVDRMTMNIMADRELEEYQKNKAYIDESKDRKSVQKSAPSSQVKWHQKTN